MLYKIFQNAEDEDMDAGLQIYDSSGRWPSIRYESFLVPSSNPSRN